MNRKILLFLTILSVMLISACTRSVDGSNTAITVDEPISGSTVEVKGLNVIEIAGTKTAMANGEQSALVQPTNEASVTESASNFPTPTPLVSLDDNGLTQPAPTATVNTLGAATQAPATQAPAATSAPIANPGTYIMHDGEFPWCLARRFDVDPVELMTLNNLSSTQTTFPAGTEITIPTSGNKFPAPRSLADHPTSYSVGYGESLYTIACKFGDVDPNAIAAANGVAVDSELTAGTTLQIP